MEIKSKEIKYVDIDQLVENPKNCNIHSKEQIDRLAKLIKHHGFRNPLVVSNRSGFVIAGHGRIQAAKKLGMKQLPVIFQDFKDEAEEYTYLTSDNSIASWAEIDLNMVHKELENLGDFDFDLLGIKDFSNIDAIETELPELNSEDPSCQQVTFILSNEQKDILDEAMAKAKKTEDCSDEINQNSNGNILSAILKFYVNS